MLIYLWTRFRGAAYLNICGIFLFTKYSTGYIITGKLWYVQGRKKYMGLFSSKEDKRAKKLELVKKLFKNSLFDHEEIVDFLIGYGDSAMINSYLVLTNKRVILKDGLKEKTAELNGIASVEQKLLSVCIKGAGFDIELKHTTYGDIITMVKNINMLKNHSTAASLPVQAPDNLDQIKKLKELLDTGIITNDEFELKKKQLLGI
jgi:hypothetical protein